MPEPTAAEPTATEPTATGQAASAPGVGVPLVIAAHGTRDPEGIAQTRAFIDRVRQALPGVYVEHGFVELAEPGVSEAVAAAVGHIPEQLAPDDPEIIVAPLMLNTGGHVERDIPGFIESGRDGHRVAYGGPLLPDPRVQAVLQTRIEQALAVDEGRPAWRAADTSLVVVNRGALNVTANAEHYRLTRYVGETLGFTAMYPCFIQVVRPSIPEALTAALQGGASKILVAPNFLFHGRLRTWLTDQVKAWREAHPQVEIRIAEVLGPDPVIAEVLADRYRERLALVDPDQGAPVYLSGLRLAERKVLVVGAGRVAERRIPRLLQAGASVQVVAPNAGIKVAQMARDGRVSWQQRAFIEADLDDAWYVLAASNDPVVNEAVAAQAQDRHVFCVRADKSSGGSAYTPATADAGGLTVAVVGHRDPRRSVRVRDELLRALQG